MTAEEMFAKIGYEVKIDGEEIIKFENDDGFYTVVSVTFDKIKKIYVVDCLGRAVYIQPHLHKAINQMVSELGWLDETD